MEVPASSCPSENELAEHAADPTRSVAIAEHVAGCESCGLAVAAVATLAGASASHGAPASGGLDAPFERGTRIGRYVVLETVGKGAMGTVYAAYDPELDRKVALKVLRADLCRGPKAGSLRERLVREARLMARLSHPEVIAVHDAGTFGEQVFIAMEFVGKGTLGAFLAARPRPVREVLDLFQRAGRGLAAAHAAGLVHRDFKPENVLVGEGGRVRVTDFGLARAEAPPPLDEAPRSSRTPRAAPADVHATATGALVGTPAYMSPEQHRGERADARSDQYSFCVALYRALYGEPPFVGATAAELGKAAARGEVREPPRGSRVPAWVRRALVRGLSAAPEARYPSMEALLADLARDPAAAWRRARVGAAVAVLVGGAAASGWAMGAFRNPCAHPEQELAGAWDERVKGRVRQALLGTGRPYAGDTVTRVIAQLDAYGASWAAMRGEVCRASGGDKQRREILGLRDACLERRRGELQALTTLFAEKPDVEVLDKAVRAAAGLPPLASCADVEALTARVRPPEAPEARARVEALEPRVARLEVLHKAGKFKEGLALGGPLLAEAEAAGYAPLRAQVQYWMALLKESTGEFDQAAALLREAAASAAEGNDDVLVAEAWGQLLYVVEDNLGRSEEASVILALGSTVLARIQDPRARANWLRAEGVVLEGQLKYAEAKAADEQALALLEKALGPSHLEVAKVLSDLAIVLFDLGDLRASLATHERALAISESALGSGHPDIAVDLTNIGHVLRALGEYDHAKDLDERALVIAENALGPDHPQVGIMLNNLGEVLLQMGDLTRALGTFERALAIDERAYGTDHVYVTGPLTGLGRTHVRLGRLDASAPLLERALAGKEKADAADPELCRPLLGLGELYLARGKPEAAAPLLERARAFGDPEFENDVLLTLAEALHRLGKDRPRARALAEEARASYERIGHRPGLERATRWLREHPGGA